MHQILCSTGALIGRPNSRDYRRLKTYAQNLRCDGFEFMVYGSWYPEIDELIKCISGMKLNIPVIHCQKALGERLCGMKAWYDDDGYHEYTMTEKEDNENFNTGIDEFAINLRVACALGAEKMVLHLWNGIPSDKNIEKNIERFGILNEMAHKAGINLMVENVICNTTDPLHNIGLLYKQYPEVQLVYDTKMAQFHRQTMKVFDEEYVWMFKDKHVKHLHMNDYNGGYLDWSNFGVLPIGAGKVDFDTFFSVLSKYGYDGDYTIEATAFDKKTGEINYTMLNECFEKLRVLHSKYIIK